MSIARSRFSFFFFPPQIFFILLTVLCAAKLKRTGLLTIISFETEFFYKSLLVAFDLEHDGSIMIMYYMKSERAPSENGRAL